MAGQVLSLFADNLAQPLLDLRIIDIIIVDPALVAGVVGRIDIDALHAPLIPGQQGFQGFKVVTPDNHVVAAVVRACLSVFIKAVLALQHPKRHFLMVIDSGYVRAVVIVVKDLSCLGRTNFLSNAVIVCRIDDLGRVVTKGSVRPFTPARWNRPHYFELESLI